MSVTVALKEHLKGVPKSIQQFLKDFTKSLKCQPAGDAIGCTKVSRSEYKCYNNASINTSAWTKLAPSVAKNTERMTFDDYVVICALQIQNKITICSHLHTLKGSQAEKEKQAKQMTKQYEYLTKLQLM